MRAKVLVVDDEFLIRMSLESGLSDLGYHVRTAESIREGTELAETFRPDVVLLDNRLGQELGLDHIEDFKKVDEDIQIIMITAYGSVSQAVEAMKRGACHYIQKPFDLEEVDLIIRRNLDQLKRRRSLELMRQRPRQIVGRARLSSGSAAMWTFWLRMTTWICSSAARREQAKAWWSMPSMTAVPAGIRRWSK